jgi:hypothetical protein
LFLPRDVKGTRLDSGLWTDAFEGNFEKIEFVDHVMIVVLKKSCSGAKCNRPSKPNEKGSQIVEWKF